MCTPNDKDCELRWKDKCSAWSLITTLIIKSSKDKPAPDSNARSLNKERKTHPQKQLAKQVSLSAGVASRG